jgi:phosphoglucosamine mutase
MMDQGLNEGLADAGRLGRAKRVDDSQARYIEFAKRSFPRQLTLEGLRVVIDCANGASYKVAPEVLWELGAEVIKIGVEPNGLNINLECGSTHPDAMCKKVREVRADLGIALDGDADRVVIADEQGRIIDGDQILALIGAQWKRQGVLTGGGVVATVMSNLGLERHLHRHGLALHRTNVGDRYVVERMREGGFNVGGEQSGHIVLSDFATTGDGLIAGLQVLAAIAETKRRASEVCHQFDPVPQVLKSVRYAKTAKGTPLDRADVAAVIKAAEARLNGSGRILVRKSGTEPVIRVMAEGDDEKLVTSVVGEICSAIEKAA